MAYDKIIVIEDPLYIHSILKNVYNHYNKVKIKLNPADQHLTSHLLGIDFENKTLLLDEFNTEVDLEELRSQEFVISGKNNDVNFRFRTRLLESGEKDHVRFFRTIYPAEIEYAQRREIYRLDLGENWQFDARIFEQDSTLEGTVLDISLGGLCIETPHKTDKSLKNQAVKLSLAIPGAEPLPCAAYVCDIRQSVKDSNKVACKFIEMDEDKSRQIQSFMFKVQREQKQQTSTHSP